MAAITTAVLANISAGGRIIATRQIYGGTFEFFNDILPGLQIETTFVDCWDSERILHEVSQGCDILYLESPTNPMLRVVDIAPLAQAGHEQGAVVMLDSTFASPINQHPADWAVDVIIHSGTKYIGGHHDITTGFACCTAEQHGKIWHYRKILGGVMDPMTAFLAQRGLQTLDLRIQKHNANALAVAEFLADHPKIKSVNYPGLPDHPDHAVAQRQMSGFGGMLSFEVAADFEQTKRFMDSLKKIKLATSLGGVTSLANQPITNTHVGLSPENRAKAGVSESLVRLSVGIEDVALLLEDLAQALDVG
jgi:cystathionine gamma-synthase